MEVRIRNPLSSSVGALATARCRDISVTDIRLEVPVSVEAELNGLQSDELYFALLGIDQVLTLGARIMSWRFNDDRIEYGLFFDQDATYDFVSGQELVTAYIARRLREDSWIVPQTSQGSG